MLNLAIEAKITKPPNYQTKITAQCTAYMVTLLRTAETLVYQITTDYNTLVINLYSHAHNILYQLVNS